MFKHEIYSLQNWNHSPQLIIYYFTSNVGQKETRQKETGQKETR